MFYNLPNIPYGKGGFDGSGGGGHHPVSKYGKPLKKFRKKRIDDTVGLG